jgi:hypothetical protein
MLLTPSKRLSKLCVCGSCPCWSVAAVAVCVLCVWRCMRLLIQQRSVRSSRVIAAASSSLSMSPGHSWGDGLSSSSGQLLRGLLRQTTQGRHEGVIWCAGPVSEMVAMRDNNQARWGDGLSSSSGQLLRGSCRQSRIHEELPPQGINLYNREVHACACMHVQGCAGAGAALRHGREDWWGFLD